MDDLGGLTGEQQRLLYAHPKGDCGLADVSEVDLILDPVSGFVGDAESFGEEKVVANGVTINGARFAFQGTAQGALRNGLVLTAISNTAAASIAGTFANPPDGAILTVNGNNFPASYEGGDGNDLTLTVVP